jgi:hypothetical protein
MKNQISGIQPNLSVRQSLPICLTRLGHCCGVPAKLSSSSWISLKSCVCAEFRLGASYAFLQNCLSQTIHSLQTHSPSSPEGSYFGSSGADRRPPRRLRGPRLPLFTQAPENQTVTTSARIETPEAKRVPAFRHAPTPHYSQPYQPVIRVTAVVGGGHAVYTSHRGQP